ncbi:hypothetical protein FOL47_006783 [Perkinsus chesapeaki]|uniref:Uncharacterized protein n=1 Tax=Perkinsus chesapeaki TaxID=330153 RepID=A0A7J6LQQ2_PERCH|nr:hypothetical protein FOL47_006783 [Perkinsus chesapeaki]
MDMNRPFVPPSKRRGQGRRRGVSVQEIMTIHAVADDGIGDLILGTLSVLPKALRRGGLACTPREQRLTLAIDLDMVAVWSSSTALAGLLASSRSTDSSANTGIHLVRVRGLNSEHKISLRLRRGLKDFVERAAQSYDVGLISDTAPTCLVRAVARVIDGGEGLLSFMRGSDEIGIAQRVDCLVPVDRGEALVLSNRRCLCPPEAVLIETEPFDLTALDDERFIRRLLHTSSGSKIRQLVRQRDPDEGVLMELWRNCFERIQYLRAGLCPQYQLSAAKAKLEVQRTVLAGCVICLGPKWPRDSRRAMRRRLGEFGAIVYINPMKAQWEHVTHILCWKREPDQKWRSLVGLPDGVWTSNRIFTVHRAWAVRVFTMWTRPFEGTFSGAANGDEVQFFDYCCEIDVHTVF